jgi:predicted DNA binding CopG/RHH family protein
MNKRLTISHVPPTKELTQEEIDNYVNDRTLPEEKEPTKRLTMDIPESLHRDFKAKCSKQGLTIADKVREMVEAWVKESP